MGKFVQHLLIIHALQIEPKTVLDMKHIYTLAVALFAAASLSAQVNVTLEVDMTDQMVDMNGVHVAGNFWDHDDDGVADNPDIGANWDPALIMLFDGDMDGVYSVTLSLVEAVYQFKFINGNSWEGVEDVPGTCQVEVLGNDNRFLEVSEEASYHVCWEACAACGMYAGRFSVDMSTQTEVSPSGVHVAGEHQGWIPEGSPLSDWDGDQIWEVVLPIDPTVVEDGLLTFKYINGNSWGDPNEYVTTDCGDEDGNREVAVTEMNTNMPVYCFDACDACTQPTSITLQVDMSTQAEVSVNGVHVAGSFQGWDAGSSPLTDVGGGIWEITLDMAPGDHTYKFINGNDWSGDGDGNIDNENLTGDCSDASNRTLTVTGESVTETWCYNQCSETCVADPDAANITFQVDMTEMVDAGTLSPDGVWLIGDMTSPNWQAGAVPMTDIDGNNIYEATLLVDGSADIQFKYCNGDPYPGDVVDPTVEEANDFETDGCGVGNGIGGFNRTHTRSGVDEVLGVYCWNSCDLCFVNINNARKESIAVFPNPANQQVTLTATVGASVRIQDAMGRVVAEYSRFSGQEVIDVTNWSSGLYTVSLHTKYSVEQIRLVIG